MSQILSGSCSWRNLKSELEFFSCTWETLTCQRLYGLVFEQEAESSACSPATAS